MRKIGISVLPARGETKEQYYNMIRDAGFEVVFTDYKEGRTARERCEEALHYGMELDNIHAPFDRINDIWVEGKAGEVMLERLLDCVDCCKEYGVSKTVVHLSSKVDAPYINDLGHARFDRLVDRAVAQNVQIAFENQRKLANLAFAMEIYKDVPQVGFCWDTGHEYCFTPGWEFMPLFGDRLICVHLQDNHAVYDGDQHLIPFDGKVDFEKAARYIKNSPYEGPIMLEVFRRPEAVTGYAGYEELSSEEYYQRAAAAAKRIRELVEKA